MKNKKRILLGITLIALLAGFLTFSYYRSNYYAQLALKADTSDEKILNLEKSLSLWERKENILKLADLYKSIGRTDLAEGIMVGRGEVEVLNKLGNLYLEQNKLKEAENTFTKAKVKSPNSTAIKGLILVELKKGDRGVLQGYYTQLSSLDTEAADCYAAYIYLNEFEKAKNSFAKAKSCNIFDLEEYFQGHSTLQNPLYLRLEAARLYYNENYLSLAEKDILSLIKDKEDYRDAHLLASKIYEKLGDTLKSNEYKEKAHKLDPVINN